MSIKDLFNKSTKILSGKTINDIKEDVESEKYTYSYVEEKERFVPRVDFKDPKNFAKYGSAEKYYNDSIERIYNTYPFDGSSKEKILWHNSSSYFDNYLFENDYPRTNGYITISPDGWGTQTALSANGFGRSNSVEYIQVKGGPNDGPNGTRVGANIYNTSSFQVSNLKLDASTGNTVEFWLKKDGFDTSKTQKEVIFDLWNRKTVSHTASYQYGRYLLYLDSNNVEPTSSFRLTYISGSTIACMDQIIGSDDGTVASSSVLNNTWNHFAVTTKNIGTSLEIKFYLNGSLSETTTVASAAMNEITGSLIANIGALRTKTSPTESPAAIQGDGKLSGSLDEFRFWKKPRSSKQIGRYWFSQVGGGTNTDKESNTSLGIYYKFNEGITGNDTKDAIVLDYSGRISHGSWVGYSGDSTVSRRSTGSAMVLSANANSEFKDPILYSTHPDVLGLIASKSESGRYHDVTNNSSLFNMFPNWIIEEDQGNTDVGEGHLKKLTQIIGSYFDTLHLQIGSLTEIKRTEYVSGSQKPYFFSNRLLEAEGFDTSEIFADADALAQFHNRSENEEYKRKLYDVKNMIYNNIYNNLSYIYKSKGTEKSFRNLVRCFGVDDELIKINLYADNSEFTIDNSYRNSAVKKKYVDFNNTSRFVSTVYQSSLSEDTNSVSFISGSENSLNSSFTMEAEVILPYKFTQNENLYTETPFTVCSLFGAHTAVTGAVAILSGGVWGTGTQIDRNWINTSSLSADLTWANDDYSDFSVYAIRDYVDSKDVYFKLTSSAGGILPELTSSVYREQYTNQKWNFAVRIVPQQLKLVDLVSETSGNISRFDVEFYGVSCVGDTVLNEFIATSSITRAQANLFLSAPKRIYGGAHRQNFTGSVLQKSDAKISSLMVWENYLDNDAIKAHAFDANNVGAKEPYRNISATNSKLNNIFVPQADTLLLNWDFSAVTSSNASGIFSINDDSSGSIENFDKYGWFGRKRSLHTGKGNFFPASSTQVVDTEFVFSAKQKLPESLDSEDMVQILQRDDEVFTRETRPIKHFFAVEKSMYQTVSEEMLKMFATIKDFNNLIGEPVNRYRQNYKSMEKLRQLFFERVQNTPDFEKFHKFYSWVDSSISKMIDQLIPASANMSGEVREVLESHVLERNKYWTKFPTLEMKHDPPEGGMIGIHRHTYDWKSGSAPVDGDETKNALWWKQRAERDQGTLSVSTTVNTSRNMILSATLSILNRKFTTPYSASANYVAIPSSSIEPMRIANFKTLYTSSYLNVTAANYSKDYEIVQTCGRSINNRALVRSGTFNYALTASVYFHDLQDYPKPQRGSNKHIFVNRFSCPGSPETAGDANGGPGLDFESGEYSVYNSINYRNLAVRGVPGSNMSIRGNLHYLLAKHCGPYGIDSVQQVQPLTYEASASFHKVNRNGLRRVFLSGSSNLVIIDKLYDNANVQHPIPQDDLGFAWVTASATSYPTGPSTSSDDYVFVSGSDYGSFVENVSLVTGDGLVEGTFRIFGADKREGKSDFIFTDFAGSSIHITDAVTGSQNKLGDDTISFGTSFLSNYLNEKFIDYVTGAKGEAAVFNAILNHRNGAYQYPLWQQVRNQNHPVVRNHRKNNIISIMTPSSVNTLKTGKALRSQNFINYVEPAVSMRNRPFIHSLIIKDEEGNQGETIFKNSYGNNLVNFANTDLVNRLDLKDPEKQIYDKFLQMYTVEKNQPENPIKDFVYLDYEETIFPQEKNMFLSKVRNRDSYTINFWNDKRVERARTNFTNSQGYVVDACSIWPLDARLNYETANTITGATDGCGELQNNYTTFYVHNTSKYLDQPTLLGNSVKSVTALNLKLLAEDAIIGKPSLWATASAPTTLGQFCQSIRIGGCSNVGQNDWSAEIPYDTGETEEFSISIWAWVTSSLASRTTYQTIATFGDNNIWFAYKEDTTNSKRKLYMKVEFDGVGAADGEWTTDAEVINVGQWHHILATFNSSSVTDTAAAYFYVDGTNAAAVEDSTPVGSVKTLVDNYCYIGSSSLDAPFQGYLSNFAVFNKALDAPAKYTELYNSGNPFSLYQSTMVNDIVSWLPLGYGEGIATGSGFPFVSIGMAETYNPCLAHKDQIFIDWTIDNDMDPVNKVIKQTPKIANVFYDMVGVFTGAAYVNYVSPQADSVPSYAQMSLTGNLIVGPEYHGLSGAADISRTSFLSNMKVGALYDRRENEYFTSSWQTITVGSSSANGGRIIRVTGSKRSAGDTKWDFSVNPFKERYSEYQNDIKFKAKDYSIIPEFRISDYVAEYIDDKNGNFLGENKNFLKVDGVEYSGSSQGGFFETYSHTDFMKYFEMIETDHENIASPTDLTLKCNAILKFIPKEGFYPAKRTLQMATLFSQSYGDYVKPYTYSETNGSAAAWRTFLTPFMAPGILYNSIKSGIAVGHPLSFSPMSTKECFKSSSWTNDMNSVKVVSWWDNYPLEYKIDDRIKRKAYFGHPYNAAYNWSFGDDTAELFSLDDADYSGLLGIDPSALDDKMEWKTVVNGNFTKVFPFEMIIEPENYVAGKTIYDIEPDYSASLRRNLLLPETAQSSIWGGNGSSKYKLAMHNFLAETANFFLQDNNFTTLQSKEIPPEGILITEENKNKYFGMDIVVSNCACKSLTDLYSRMELPEYSSKTVYDYQIRDWELDEIKGVHTKMYEKQHSFGPPWIYNYTNLTSSYMPRRNLNYGYEPFTPCYFDGFATARLFFYPYKGAGFYSLDDIQSHITSSYVRIPSNREGAYGLYSITKAMEMLTAKTIDKNSLILRKAYDSFNISEDIIDVASSSQNWNMMNHSFNLLGKTKVKKQTYEKGVLSDYNVSTIEDAKIDVNYVWSIQPKWETPILNFKNSTVVEPLYGSGSNTYGMWHQLGSFPTKDEGLFLSISDLPDKEISSLDYKKTPLYDGTVFINRKENILELEREGAEIVIYIKDYAALNTANASLSINLDEIQKDFRSQQMTYRRSFIEGTHWTSATSNFNAAVNLSNFINNETDVPADFFGLIDSKIQLKTNHYLSSSAFIPVEHPWSTTMTASGIDPVAAIKVKVIDKIARDDKTVNTLVFGNYSQYYKTSDYPDFVAPGSKGNKIKLSLDSILPSAWALKCANDSDRSVGFHYKGYFYGGKDNKFQVDSLADLLGFSKTPKRLGEVAKEKIIKEAVVAVPYIEQGKQKKFFTIPRRYIDIAQGLKKSATNDEVGRSVYDMVLKMKNYIFPPKMDFLTYNQITPFVMYIFEFESKLNKNDLANIWQNLPPSFVERYEMKESTISHKVLKNELLGGELKNKIRWMVFKVKQKGEKNYYAKTADSFDDDKFKFNFGNNENQKRNEKIPEYSYNWPYDFFSIVQLIKLDAKVKFSKKKE